MPELPEVETVVRGLRKVLKGQTLAHVIQRRADLRRPFPERFAQRLEGQKVADVTRRAKYILIHLAGGDIWLCHLGMSGSMVVSRDRPHQYEKHDHLVFATEAGHWIRYNDARRFGVMDLITPTDLRLVELGVEPLSRAFTGSRLLRLFAGKAVALKLALLDQRLIAGIGNIYASEALYRAGLSPLRSAGALTPDEAQRLVVAIRAVLSEAIQAGGSSLRDYVRSDGELGYFQHHWKVYGKEGHACPDCACDAAETGGIKRITQGQRSSFYCPRRQR
ncbi:MAG TPA: bifunctional DNA-formamidopyrimidine glycosylase/DNA-(apurinic or apyrimidinic site) lyase [Dongiaceae bacterium]|jgi:formamidopyrimidine-DNA glycosylase|nr:bifunctional DNA-formamidopyrimidine glycosylase/DNA-(apurinic or apyrimidinic site) lyase [Dongiaceae bacterium]